MAFMPEDVLNKSFTATQFRRGYEEREVDDFLDEIVVELRRLGSVNDELSAKLKACQESKGITVARGAAVGAPAAGVDKTAQREAAAASVAAAASKAAAEREARERIAAAKLSAEQAEKQAAARIAKAKAGAEQVEAQSAERVKAAKEAAQKGAKASVAVPAATAPRDEAPNVTDVANANAAAAASASAAGVLALAQKLHDQYVSEGQSTRERLINEGQERHDKVVGEVEARRGELLSTAQAKHDALIAEAAARHEQLITEARERSTGMVAEAQQKKAAVLHALARERDVLQKKIDELRTFERDYRARLKAYLEGQLHELSQTGADKAANDRGGQNQGHGGEDGVQGD